MSTQHNKHLKQQLIHSLLLHTCLCMCRMFFLENVYIRKLLLKLSIKISCSLMNSPAFKQTMNVQEMDTEMQGGRWCLEVPQRACKLNIIPLLFLLVLKDSPSLFPLVPVPHAPSETLAFSQEQTFIFCLLWGPAEYQLAKQLIKKQ